MQYDEKYMWRALELAARSKFDTHPNPCVGAVIVSPDGRIIGEGYHRRCGHPHAEVNAIASVSDSSLLRDSTMYVTLEPCSHYGKTPPCASLIIRSGVPRVVVGAVDPFEKVSGRGLQMLRDAGVEVVSGVLAEESRRLNIRFFTAHTLRRPFVTLKWAQSSDGFIDYKRTTGQPAARFSNTATSMLVHRQRALHDAILTSAATVMADNPQLTLRHWDGPQPRRVIIDRSDLLSPDLSIFAPGVEHPLLYTSDGSLINCSSRGCVAETVLIERDATLPVILTDLYRRGITSLLVEAGQRLLQAFINQDLADCIRVETAPFSLGCRGSVSAPCLPSGLTPATTCLIAGNTIAIYHPER